MFPFKLLSLPVVCFGLSALSATSAAPFAPESMATFAKNTKALSVRGGAGPLGVEDTAKYSSALYLAHAVYQKLAPGKSAEAYGLEVDPKVEYTSLCNANVNLVIGCASALMFWKTPSTNNRAIGAGMIFAVLGNLGRILNDTPEGIGEKVAKSTPFYLLLDSFITHALLTGADYADTALKLYSLWLIGIGATLVFNPSTTAWDDEGAPENSLSQKVMNSVIGQNLVALGTFCGSIAFGKSPSVALGYAFGVILLNVINNMFVSKLFVDVGMKTGPMYIWIAILATAFVTLGIDAPSASVADTATP